MSDYQRRALGDFCEYIERSGVGVNCAQYDTLFRSSAIHSPRSSEWEAPWLSGYQGSKPVRIGNDLAKT